jgi:hypothetical protein
LFHFRSQWTLITGATVELLHNSPFTTLQLSPDIVQKSLPVYGVTPMHTLTGSGTVLVENLTLLVPSQLDDPFVSFLLALSVKVCRTIPLQPYISPVESSAYLPYHFVRSTGVTNGLAHPCL